MRHDVSEANALFLIHGEARADTLNRVVGLFVQLGLTPERVTMWRDEDMAHIEIVQDELDAPRAAIVAEKMRSMVSVTTVTLEYGSQGA